jgi:hypothetical protein
MEKDYYDYFKSLDHRDSLPLPDGWLESAYRVECELINMYSNVFLELAAKMWSKNDPKLDANQNAIARRYARICELLMERRGI